MSKVKVDEHLLYRKMMRLNSDNLEIALWEHRRGSDRPEVEIYHTPFKWEFENRTLVFKTQQGLLDYIAALQDFVTRYKEDLDHMTKPSKSEDE